MKALCDKLACIPVVGKFFDKAPKVAIIRMSGIISDMNRRHAISYPKVAKALEKAFEKSGIAAVALVINSPGGAPAQSSLIGTLVRQLAEENDVPVYAFVEDVAASGGYWLACAADKIYAQETSIIGSIGVISASFGLEDFIERHGIHRRLHTSGGQKSFLDPFKPEKAEDVERLKTVQNEMHNSFIAWVKERRDNKLIGVDRELFDGRFWTGKVALGYGLIDGIGDVRGICREKFGETVKLIPVGQEKKWPFPLSLMGARTGITDELIEAVEHRSSWGRYGL